MRLASERIQHQIDRLLDEAEEAVSQLNWAAVRIRARTALRLDPVNNDALSYLAAAETELQGSRSPSSSQDSSSTAPDVAISTVEHPTAFAETARKAVMPPRLLEIGRLVLWASFIFATSSLVIDPQEFFSWVHQNIVVNEALFWRFEVFWMFSWFVIVKRMACG